jgi:hypothetical protein
MNNNNINGSKYIVSGYAPSNPKFVKPSKNNGKVNYNSLLTTIQTLVNDKDVDGLIIKLGNNDTTTNGGLNNPSKWTVTSTRRTGSGKLRSVNVEHTGENLTPKQIKNLMIGEGWGKNQDRGYNFIQITPDEKAPLTFSPFKKRGENWLSLSCGNENNNQCFQEKGWKLKNSSFLRAAFPLAPTITNNTLSNQIIQLLINYPKPLVIVNSIGSACYLSIENILVQRFDRFMKNTNNINYHTTYVTQTNNYARCMKTPANAPWMTGRLT